MKKKNLFLRELIESGESQASLSRRLGVSEMTIHHWLERFEFPDSQKINSLMARTGIPSTLEELQQELARLRKEKRQLEKELEKEKVRSLAYS